MILIHKIYRQQSEKELRIHYCITIRYSMKRTTMIVVNSKLEIGESIRY